MKWLRHFFISCFRRLESARVGSCSACTVSCSYSPFVGYHIRVSTEGSYWCRAWKKYKNLLTPFGIYLVSSLHSENLLSYLTLLAKYFNFLIVNLSVAAGSRGHA